MDEHDSWIGAPIFGDGLQPSPDRAASLGGDDEGSAMGLVVSVAAALSMVLVAILLARRRSRHDEPVPAGVGAAAADAGAPSTSTIPLGASIADDGPIPNVRPLPPMRELIPPVNPALLDEDPQAEGGDPRAASDEQGVPRWLRPSVREARFANDRDRRRSNWG